METAALVFAGIVVSFVVEFVKRKYELSTFGTLTVVLCLSVLLGTGYWAALTYGFLSSIIAILTACGATYAFIIRNLKTDEL